MPIIFELKDIRFKTLQCHLTSFQSRKLSINQAYNCMLLLTKISLTAFMPEKGTLCICISRSDVADNGSPCLSTE